VIETASRTVVFGERPYYARSPFQVGLLSFCTFGIYVLWWSYYTRRSAAALLDEPDHPFWMSAALFVPLFNLWVWYDLLERTRGLALRAGERVSGGLLVAGIAWIAFWICSRLPQPLGALSFLSFACLAYAQSFVTRAEFVLSDYTVTPGRFTGVETLVVIVGGGFKLAVFLGLLFDQHASSLVLSRYWPFIVGVEALALAVLAFTYLKSRTALES
jgi:hypothetical protein